MEEVLFLLASYGVTFLLCDARILSVPRAALRRIPPIDEFLGCYFCVGFWVSLVLYLVRDGLMESREDAVQFVIHGFGGAAFAYVLNAVALWLESYQVDEYDLMPPEYHEEDDDGD